MQWDDVQLLLAMLRAKNLQDASRRLGVDRSTISRRVVALEERMKARLFVRSRNGMRPTETAERLRPHAEQMEAGAAALLQAVSESEERISGVVRLATTEAFATLVVREGLLGLRAQHPELGIELLAGNGPVDLARDADVAVRLSPLEQPNLRARCVARLGIGLFASPAYLRARGPVRTVRALRGHDVLLPSGELARMPESKWLAERPGVRVVFRSNCMPALIAAAEAGQGIVPLPIGWGETQPGLERLVAVDAVPARQVWLVTHETSTRRAAVRVVCERLVAIFARVFAR